MEEHLSDDIIEALGITRPVYEEMTLIMGRLPSIEDISTLLAMWDANGRQQSLYGWLKGMHHTVELSNYVYRSDDDRHLQIKEPRVAECIEIAKSLNYPHDEQTGDILDATGELIYMVGDVSSIFLDSDYARMYLHIADDPMTTDDMTEVCEYTEMVLDSLRENSVISGWRKIAGGGLFGALVAGGGGRRGFDILTCREVRLDSFLFGEENGRYVAVLAETSDDQYLLKLGEARLNCCFLGRVTKGRIVVDGTDFGPASWYCHS